MHAVLFVYGVAVCVLMQLRPLSDWHMRPREASSYVNSWKIYFYQSHSEDRLMGACG